MNVFKEMMRKQQNVTNSMVYNVKTYETLSNGRRRIKREPDMRDQHEKYLKRIEVRHQQTSMPV